MEDPIENKEGNSSDVASSSTYTTVKYSTTSCHFCNEFLDSEAFKEHIIHCGQVLEPCPHSCTSHVQRKHLRSHLKECPKVRKRCERDASTSADFPNTFQYENRILLLEQDISALRSVLNEEIKQRLHLITDVGCLRKHNQIYDEWTQKVGDILNALKRCINEETTSRNCEFKNVYDDMGKLHFQYTKILDWQRRSAIRIDKIHNQMVKSESVNEKFATSKNNDEDTNFMRDNISSMKSEIDDLMLSLKKIGFDASESCNFLSDRVTNLERYFVEVTNSYGRQVTECIEQMNILRAELHKKFIQNSDLNTKQITLDVEVKSMKNIVHETEEKCDGLEKTVKDSNKAVHQIEQNLADLEIHLRDQKLMMAINNTKGHLIWKIEKYSEKLSAAKEHDIMIQSAVFCNKQYGYSLTVHAYLDGLGRWKGRNLIACLNVVPGEFDALLPWPCKLQAEFILRDQQDNQEDAVDYVRTIIVKRRTDNYRTNHYIHIDHKVIEDRNYCRNNTIFLEVKVLRNVGTGSGTAATLTSSDNIAGPSRRLQASEISGRRPQSYI